MCGGGDGDDSKEDHSYDDGTNDDDDDGSCDDGANDDDDVNDDTGRMQDSNGWIEIKVSSKKTDIRVTVNGDECVVMDQGGQYAYRHTYRHTYI